MANGQLVLNFLVTQWQVTHMLLQNSRSLWYECETGLTKCKEIIADLENETFSRINYHSIFVERRNGVWRNSFDLMFTNIQSSESEEGRNIQIPWIDHNRSLPENSWCLRRNGYELSFQFVCCSWSLVNSLMKLSGCCVRILLITYS
jgi:hypothetical protein